MNLIQFNINETVRVRLTDIGRAELKRQHDELNARIIAIGGKPFETWCPEEVDGWSRWQLWRLMEQLGHLCHIGSDGPFETNIVLEKE